MTFLAGVIASIRRSFGVSHWGVLLASVGWGQGCY